MAAEMIPELARLADSLKHLADELDSHEPTEVLGHRDLPALLLSFLTDADRICTWADCAAVARRRGARRAITDALRDTG